ncbi:hypothetical protein SAMD00079811_71680 [Scytonema sp. HK-05]|uniref:hypothetical protein n=1 Tax=Scytonema sp. HK-05 TaxID=1137095 RepID=UPI00093785C1|nr:hypothetical protein [Scytonema sp. HK-05]OKH55891.1 hypothetical protein NIES2130_26140 [Scytonema sp. HK-05]BAY49539.1 hypothetical protein SAMD00079811_71680 [Scytonema sp. HK-05]
MIAISGFLEEKPKASSDKFQPTHSETNLHSVVQLDAALLDTKAHSPSVPMSSSASPNADNNNVYGMHQLELQNQVVFLFSPSPCPSLKFYTQKLKTYSHKERETESKIDFISGFSLLLLAVSLIPIALKGPCGQSKTSQELDQVNTPQTVQVQNQLSVNSYPFMQKLGYK